MPDFLADDRGRFFTTNLGRRIVINNLAQESAITISASNFSSVRLGDDDILREIVSIGERLFIVGDNSYFLRYRVGAGTTKLAPFGVNDITGIAVGQTDRLVALAANGIHYSDNFGATWTQASTDTSMSSISSNGAGVIVAASTSSGTGLVSVDNGATFSAAAQNDALAIASTQSSRYFPEISQFVNLCSGGIINASSDGVTWTRRDLSATAGSPLWAAQDIFAGVLYVGDDGGQLYQVATDFSSISADNNSFYRGSDYPYRALHSSGSVLYTGQGSMSIQYKTATQAFSPATVSASEFGQEQVLGFVDFDDGVWGIHNTDALRSLAE